MTCIRSVDFIIMVSCSREVWLARELVRDLVCTSLLDKSKVNYKSTNNNNNNNNNNNVKVEWWKGSRSLIV